MPRFCRLLIITAASFGLFAATAEQPPKELVSYIEGARKLGLADEQIRKNTAAAGWNARLVDEAFAAVAVGRTPAAPALPAAASEGHRIGPGDVVQVQVWREPDTSVPSAVVRTDGNISMPLIKDVAIAGFTPAEAEKAIAAKLSRYIQAADVTVIVREVHSRKAYMVGSVRTVGPVPLIGQMTVLQAITQAGGLTDYAKRKQIYILRMQDGKQVKLPFNYESVIKGEAVEQNVMVLPNDTIVVP